MANKLPKVIKYFMFIKRKLQIIFLRFCFFIHAENTTIHLFYHNTDDDNKTKQCRTSLESKVRLGGFYWDVVSESLTQVAL